ncbi:MAG: hypothetical protein R3B45_02570 [Bdellovibrionota bacterium]
MDIIPYYQRSLRVCYYSTESRVLDANKILLENKLKQLGVVSIVQIKSLDDPKINPCDLLLVEATQIPHEGFSKWLFGFGKRLVQQASIWTPALFISKTQFGVLNTMLEDSIYENWYFDILDPDHMDSLPIRVANLLKIHDHLHEIKRYQNVIETLQANFDQLNNKLSKIKSDGR